MSTTDHNHNQNDEKSLHRQILSNSLKIKVLEGVEGLANLQNNLFNLFISKKINNK
jgi:hypothetical protein